MPLNFYDEPSLKLTETMGAPKIEGSFLEYRVPRLWPTYIHEMRTTFAKAYGIKVRCYGEHVGEPIWNLGNILGTWWESIGNLKGTWNTLGTREKWKKKTFHPSPFPQTYKEKARHLDGMLGPSHWLHEISLPKRVHHHFWPGLIRLAKNTLLIEPWPYSLKL